MGKDARVVRLSTKGQIVIPSRVRRECGLRAGDRLTVTVGKEREIVFAPVEKGAKDLDRMLAEARAWFKAWMKKSGRDPMREFEKRRREQRSLEAKRRERWSP